MCGANRRGTADKQKTNEHWIGHGVKRKAYLSTFDAVVVSAISIGEYPVLVFEASVTSNGRVSDGCKSARGF